MPLRPYSHVQTCLTFGISVQFLKDLSTSKILNCIEDSVHGLSLDDEVEIETKVAPIADKVLKPTCYIRSVISQVNRTDTGQYLGHFAVISFGSRGNFRFFNFKIVIFERF